MMVGLGQVVHQIGKGISKRTVRIPIFDLRARDPKAFLPDTWLKERVPSCSGGT